MECGVHGPLGRLVVKRVETVPKRGNGYAIIQNPPTMARPAWVLDSRSEDAMPTLPAQVRYILPLDCNLNLPYRICGFSQLKTVQFDKGKVIPYSIQ